MKAAVLTTLNSPLEIREIEWQPLRFGQCLVKVLSTGICGAQLAEIRGDKNENAPIPRLLGHEACVEVLGVGEGVTTVKPGDRCVAHWRKGDGVESQFPTFTLEGKHHKYTAGLITTFSEFSVISENRITVVSNDTPEELCALLGCGLSTALGVIENEANLKIGERILIIGCGGLGLNLILAAKLRQASRIVVMDTAIDKMELAISMGAEFRDWLGLEDLFDVVIDTTGNSEAISAGLFYLAKSGRFIMVGQPKPYSNVIIPDARRMFDGTGKTILATQGGRFNPSTDIPRYVSAYQKRLINLDGLVTHRLPLSEINEAIDLVRRGQAGRILINCDQ